MKFLQKLTDPGRIANEETATHQGARSSKPGVEEEKEEKGVKEDFKAGSENVRDNGGGEDEVVRKLPTRKMSLTRRQSRDLMKKKTSFEEQVLFSRVEVGFKNMALIRIFKYTRFCKFNNWRRDETFPRSRLRDIFTVG